MYKEDNYFVAVGVRRIITARGATHCVLNVKFWIFYKMGLNATTPVFGVSGEAIQTQSAQLHRLAKMVKFR